MTTSSTSDVVDDRAPAQYSGAGEPEQRRFGDVMSSNSSRPETVQRRFRGRSCASEIGSRCYASAFRTGLDHLAFEAAHEEDLEAWIAHFDALGVEHSPIRDLGHSAFVSIEDPDGIQFEMWFTRVPHTAGETSRINWRSHA